MPNFSEEALHAKILQLMAKDDVGTINAVIDEFQQNMNKSLLATAMLTGEARILSATMMHEISDAVDRIATNAILADMSKAEPRQ